MPCRSLCGLGLVWYQPTSDRGNRLHFERANGHLVQGERLLQQRPGQPQTSSCQRAASLRACLSPSAGCRPAFRSAWPRPARPCFRPPRPRQWRTVLRGLVGRSVPGGGPCGGPGQPRPAVDSCEATLRQEGHPRSAGPVCHPVGGRERRPHGPATVPGVGLPLSGGLWQGRRRGLVRRHSEPHHGSASRLAGTLSGCCPAAASPGCEVGRCTLGLQEREGGWQRPDPGGADPNLLLHLPARSRPDKHHRCLGRGRLTLSLGISAEVGQ